MISFKQFLLEGSQKGSGSSCIMLYFNNHYMNQFKKITSKINPKDLWGENDGYGLETKFHVTIKYGLYEQDLDVIHSTIGELNPIPVKLKKSLSLFENQKYDVLKLNVSGDELREFNRRVEKIFDWESDFDKYIPHVTIGYLQPGSGKKYLNLDSPLFGQEITLSQLVISNKYRQYKYIDIGK